jgi:hypothetical protein
VSLDVCLSVVQAFAAAVDAEAIRLAAHGKRPRPRLITIVARHLIVSNTPKKHGAEGTVGLAIALLWERAGQFVEFANELPGLRECSC